MLQCDCPVFSPSTFQYMPRSGRRRQRCHSPFRPFLEGAPHIIAPDIIRSMRIPIFLPATFLVLCGAEKEPAKIEQTAPGKRPPAELVASFDGLGFGFTGPQGTMNA